MKRLLAVITVFYCLGIILVNLFRVNFGLILGLGIAILAAACFSLRKKYIFPILIFFLALLLGGLNLKNSYLLPKCHISNFVPYKDNTVYSLSGFVDDAPEIKNARTSFVFRAQEAQVNQLKWRCCGKVLTKLDFPQELRYGDKLIITGNLSRPAGFGDNRQTYRDYLARQGIYSLMHIKNSLQIIPQSGLAGSKLTGFSFWLRERCEQVISRHLPDLPASILSAMVLGQRRGIPWLVNNAMVKSGTVHILVVSGFNVGIVAFIVNLLLKIMRVRRKARIILASTCLLIYCLATGATNPVIRATVMGIMFLLAYIFKREPEMYNSLAGAALFILIVNPRQLFDVGFQLSFASVLSIVYLYPKLKAFLRIAHIRVRVLRFICEGCIVSFSAWMGTMGIIAYNFRIICPVTVLANILIVP
ncbi:MAG: ComEC/Rec2 family competence protein, partial [Candidatus Omnitrophota bacterium]|nr:ComEC/Rec2 family competence protein [Candidatus Omnitrophota bacterium]